MNYKVLGDTGLRVSELAFGGVEIGLPYGLSVSEDHKLMSEQEAIHLLHQSLDAGVNFYDTARLYHKDSTLAGMTAVMIIMFCAYASNVGNKLSNKSMFSSSVLQINALLLALLVGYAVGEIFHWLGKNHQPVEFEHVHRVRTRAWNALLPASVSIIAGMILGIIIY